MQVNDRARYAYQYYLRKGLSPEAAAGIVANLAIESGNFDPAVISGQRRGDKSTAAYVQQLRHGRQDNFEQFASATKRSPTDIDAQLDFVLEEMDPKSDWADAQAAKNRDAILSASDPRIATQSFMAHYERASSDPKYNHIDKRLAYADNLYGQAPSDMVNASKPEIKTANLDEQQVAQMRSQDKSPAIEQDINYSALGLIRAGEILQRRRNPLVYQSVFDPQGVSTDASLQSATPPQQTDRPVEQGVDDKTIPLGKDVANSTAAPTLQFGIKPAGDNVDLAGMSEQTRSALAMAANQFGRDITINSGYRSQARQDQIRNSGDPNRITVAKDSRHTHGDASDISIAGMSKEEIALLVDSLAGSGFNAFGYYPTHIHADMRSAVPRSFNPDTNWGGWTKLPPEVMAALVKRGFRPGATADQLTRGFATQ